MARKALLGGSRFEEESKRLRAFDQIAIEGALDFGVGVQVLWRHGGVSYAKD